VDFSLDDEQLAFKKTVIDFGSKELISDILALDCNSEFNWGGFRKMCQVWDSGSSHP
jgi:hypothetical protein